MTEPLPPHQAAIAAFSAEGARKSATRRRRLTLEDVEAALAPLTDLESAMHRLDMVGKWALAGMVAGAVGSVVVRSVEVWIRGHESKLTREVVEQLRGRLEDLESQITRQKFGRVS